MGISQAFGDILPIRRFVQVDADPSARTRIGRREIALRRSGDEQILRRVRRLAPDRVPAAAVMIRRIGEHRERSLPGPERRLAMRQFFKRVWQRQAHLPDALDRTSCHRATCASEPAADDDVCRQRSLRGCLVSSPGGVSADVSGPLVRPKAREFRPPLRRAFSPLFLRFSSCRLGFCLSFHIWIFRTGRYNPGRPART